MQKRRYEILLPLRHNDGRPVSGELFDATREELVRQFGALSISPHAVLGVWIHAENRYEDQLLRYMVDVEDSDEIREFFTSFKRSLLDRFEQLEIYVVSYPVDVL